MTGTRPHELWSRTGGGDAYRVAMLEHGHVYPTPPWDRKQMPGKRAQPCGLTHEPDWSVWRTYDSAGRLYEGRWCRVCAHTEARAS